MPSADQHWRRGVIWAVLYGVAAVVLPVRSLAIALHLDALRGVPAWPDWLLAVGLALVLGGIAGLFARGAVLRRARWAWRQAQLAEPRPVPRDEQHQPTPIKPIMELPLTLRAEWRPLWLRIAMSPIFFAACVLVAGSIFACVSWGLLILVPLVNPEVVYHPMLRLRFFYLYLIMPVWLWGIVFFGGQGMAFFPWSPTLTVDAQGLTRVSALGRRRTIRWEDARLLECREGVTDSDPGTYRQWALSSQDTVITWDHDLARYGQLIELARLIYQRTGLVPYELKQQFWKRSPLVAQVVREVPPEDDSPDEKVDDGVSRHASPPGTEGS